MCDVISRASTIVTIHIYLASISTKSVLQGHDHHTKQSPAFVNYFILHLKPVIYFPYNHHFDNYNKDHTHV